MTCWWATRVRSSPVAASPNSVWNQRPPIMAVTMVRSPWPNEHESKTIPSTGAGWDDGTSTPNASEANRRPGHSCDILQGTWYHQIALQRWKQYELKANKFNHNNGPDAKSNERHSNEREETVLHCPSYKIANWSGKFQLDRLKN